MEYKIVKKDGYILGVGEVPFRGNISRKEYDEITDIINQKPVAPEGFYYRLKENLEWELCEMPPIEEVATEEDYKNALESFGVNLNA